MTDEGPTGPAGEQGHIGETGETGARGMTGADGRRGPRGNDGEDQPAAEWDTVRIATLLMLAIVAITVAALIWFLMTYVAEQRARSECYRDSFKELNASLVITVGAAGRDRRGLLDLLTSLTDPERPREQRAADLETYKRTLASSEAERSTNPILPARTC